MLGRGRTLHILKFSFLQFMPRYCLYFTLLKINMTGTVSHGCLERARSAFELRNENRRFSFTGHLQSVDIMGNGNRFARLNYGRWQKIRLFCYIKLLPDDC